MHTRQKVDRQIGGSRSAPLLTLLNPSTVAAYTAAGFWGYETIYNLAARHARTTPRLARCATAIAVALTCTAPPHQATHWTGRAMAKAVGISVGSVQRIWRAHKLQPHRLRTFKRSRDPGFAAKLTDIVGLALPT